MTPDNASTSHRSQPSGRQLVPYRIANVVLFSLGLLLLLILKLANVSDDFRLQIPGMNSGVPELCVYQQTQSRACSTCGMTRSVVLLLDGEYRRSQSFDTRAVEMVAFLLLQITLRGLFALRRIARYWKWDAVITTTAIIVCFARIIAAQIPLFA